MLVTTDEVLAAIAEAKAELGRDRGATVLAAVKLGVSPPVISYHRSKAGENAYAPRPSRDVIEQAWEESGHRPMRCAELLGRKWDTTVKWLEDEGLYSRRDWHRWSEEELRYVKAHYPRARSRPGGVQALAQELGVTDEALMQIAVRLNFTESHGERRWQWGPKAWTNEEIDALLANLSESDDSASRWARKRGLGRQGLDELRRRNPRVFHQVARGARERSGAPTGIGEKLERKAKSEIWSAAQRHGLKHFVVRIDDPRSRGAGDISVLGYGMHYEVQSEDHGSFDVAKWNRLFRWCQMQNAVPLVVRTGKNGQTEYFRMTALKTGKRVSMPMEPWDWEEEFKRLGNSKMVADFDALFAS